MKQITNFDGLYGELDARPSTNYIFSERIETRSPAFNWVINPHVHTHLFQFFFIETGQVQFKEASKETFFTAPCILVIPSSSLHGLTYTPNATGRILTISDVLVESLFPVSSAVAVSFSQIQPITTFESPYFFSWIIQLIGQLDEELFNDRLEKQLMLQLYLNQLFIVLHRLLKSTEEAQTQQGNLTLKYFSAFQRSIKKLEFTKSIPDYAQELGISTVHLNRVCQSVAGKSALQVVQEQQVKEAQKYLKYTSYTVSEIAYLLNFEYPNYFARLFKKHTGLSPTEFREQ